MSLLLLLRLLLLRLVRIAWRYRVALSRGAIAWRYRVALLLAVLGRVRASGAPPRRPPRAR